MILEKMAAFIKSTNAGATMLTFDIGFDDLATLEHVLQSKAINADLIGEIYHVLPGQVEIFPYYPALTIKITIPRSIVSGGTAERDFDGVQQFSPLLDLDIPTPQSTAAGSADYRSSF